MTWRDDLTPEQERALAYWLAFDHGRVLTHYYDEGDPHGSPAAAPEEGA